ncbi:MAG: hypothetical protein U0R80_13490 [Nocardioidaceae bacterium]
MSARRTDLLAPLLVAQAAGLTLATLLGPLVLDRVRYRTSATTLNQLLGADAATLAVVVPLALVAAWLVGHGHPAGGPLATGVGGYTVYTYAQLVIGQEYLRLPGNVERFFPLYLVVFVVAEAVTVLGCRRMPATIALPARTRRLAGWVLVGVAAFLVIGLHLRTMLTAWSDPRSMTEYASAPTPFWMVKLMDLGIVVPLALVAGIGLLRGSLAAARLAYPILSAYVCLAASVTAMALVMLVHDDPDASWGLALGFGFFAVALAGVVVTAYRPLFGADLPA